MPSQRNKTIKNTVILLFVVIAISVSCRSEDNHINTSQFYSDCQRTINSIYAANPESIGIMVHIESPKNNLSWSGCSGYSNKDERIELTSDQPALIASTIKPYIAATILRLEEQKKLTIDDPIGIHLTEKTTKLFEEDGYDFNNIKIKHLLSHTSGIEDYVDTLYLNWIDKNPKYRWTREEQLRLTVTKGDPLGSPGDVYSYADANFLLCTEIIESNSNKPYYTAIRDLLKYEDLGFRNTWFPTLENPKSSTKSLVHQYWSSREWDSYDIDPSFDLYGGGGIATTTKELAQFSYNLFQGNIIDDTTTLNKLFTKITPSNGEDTGYFLGLGESSSNGFTYYGHYGFWGTEVLFFPKLEASVAVYILEKDKFKLIEDVTNVIVYQLAKQLNKN